MTAALLLIVIVLSFLLLSASLTAKQRLKDYNEAFAGWERSATALRQIERALPGPTCPDTQTVVDRTLVALALVQRRPTMDDVENARARYQRIVNDQAGRLDRYRREREWYRRTLDNVEQALRGEKLTRGHDDPEFPVTVVMALNLRRDLEALRKAKKR